MASFKVVPDVLECYFNCRHSGSPAGHDDQYRDITPHVYSHRGDKLTEHPRSGRSSHWGPRRPAGDTQDRPALPCPYNPAASLSPRIVKKILALEFVEMDELRGDIWSDDSPMADPQANPRRSTKPPVNTIRTWLECFGRMAAVLTARYPEKAPELWAYQSTIVKSAHNYEGANWVAYDRQYRRDMLARKDLNWSTPNVRLYNEAFTGRARTIPSYPHCLSEDHGSANCPHNPNPPILGWF